MSVASIIPFGDERRAYLGASEVAAVLGLSRWTTPHRVARIKLGLEQPGPSSEAAEWGHLLETAILSKWEAHTGASLKRPTMADPLEVFAPTTPFLRGHLDAISIGPRKCPDCGVVSRGPVIVDAKAPGWRAAEHWGEVCTDDVPDEYGVQGQVYCGLAGVEQFDLSVLIGGNDWRIYHVHFDRELFAQIVSAAGKWWREHVEAGVLPPVDGDDSTAHWLKSRWPREEREMIQATHAHSALMDRLRVLRAEIDERDIEKKRIENELRLEVADAAGIVGDGWTLHYKRTKDSPKTDWERAFKALADNATEEQIARAVMAGAYTAPGVRRFMPKWKKEAK